MKTSISRQRLRRRLWWGFGLLVPAVLLAFGRMFYLGIVYQVDEQPDVKVFRAGGGHLLAAIGNRWLVINLQERSVVSASTDPMFCEFGGLGLAREDRFKGVLLGDGVKGVEEESWAFGDKSIDVEVVRPVRRRVRIPLE